MALDLITGRAGKAHVGSEDVRAYNAQTAGGGRYVLDGGEATIQSANEVKIAPAELLVDGAHVRITGTGEVVSIDNGASSYKRVDIIALHYKRTGGEDDAIETMELVAVKGTPADDSPADPEMPATGSILDDVAETYIPYARVLIDGLTPQTPTVLLDQYALPIEHGGTGAKTARAANYNILNNAIDRTADVTVVTDDTRVGFFTSTGSTENGSLQKLQFLAVWNYIAGKIRSVFGFSSSNVLPASHGGTGQTSLQATRNAMGLGNTTGALPVANGGTGVTTDKAIALKAYPVGAVYISYNSTSPASLFGGTWTAITGRFPYFNAGTGTGGSNSHTLSVNEMPAHQHSVVQSDSGLGGVGGSSSATCASGSSMWVPSGQIQNLKANTAGGSAAFSTMPAYQTLYAWRRTA